MKLSYKLLLLSTLLILTILLNTTTITNAATKKDVTAAKKSEIAKIKYTLGRGIPGGTVTDETIKKYALVKVNSTKYTKGTFFNKGSEIEYRFRFKLSSSHNIRISTKGTSDNETFTLCTIEEEGKINFITQGGYYGDLEFRAKKDVQYILMLTPFDSHENQERFMKVATVDEKTVKINESINLYTKNLKGYTWKSSHPKVAKVDSKGKVTGVKAGRANIIATKKDMQYKFKVTVEK